MLKFSDYFLFNMYEYSKSRSISNFLNNSQHKLSVPPKKIESSVNGILYSGKSTPSLIKNNNNNNNNLSKTLQPTIKQSFLKPLGNLRNEENAQSDQVQNTNSINNKEEQKNISKNLLSKNALMELRPRPSRAVININSTMSADLMTASSCQENYNSSSSVEFSDLHQIILKAKNNYTYAYKCETKPEDKIDKSVIDALDSLSIFAGDTNTKSKFSSKDLSMLFEMLSLHIFHSFPDISNTYIIGESVSPYFMNNWDQLSRIYALLSLLLPEILPFITDEVFEKFIKQLSSPFNSEQEAVLSFIEKVCQKSEDHQSKVFQMMTRVVQLFIDGECLHFCLIPIFNFLTNFLDKLTLPINLSYFEVFRSVFYQTIISPNVVDFYNALLPLAQFFQSKDSTTSVWCIRFLFRHWPITNSEKQIIFLHQLQFILSMLNSSFFPALSKALVSRLKQMIESVNFKVSMAAIKILKDEEFVKLICSTTSSPSLSSPSVLLIPSLEAAQSHWNNDVRVESLEALNLIKANTKGKFLRSVLRNGPSQPQKHPIRHAQSYQEKYQHNHVNLEQESQDQKSELYTNVQFSSLKRKYGSYAHIPNSSQMSKTLSISAFKNNEKLSASSKNLIQNEHIQFSLHQPLNQEKKQTYKPLSEKQKQWNFLLKLATKYDKDIDQNIYKSIIRTLDDC